ncbi:MAG: class I SAM-dependent methyltransferase [Spirochaetota bacterium]
MTNRIFRICYRIYVTIFPEPISNPLAYRIRRFVALAAKRMPDKSRVLDAGAGDAQYRPLFKDHDYVSLDKTPAYGIDIVADVSRMPVQSGSFDAVLSMQVLEHVPDPERAMKEMCRVLKKGGYLFLCVPQIHPPHMEPHDYFRYTSYGVRSLAEHVGFSVVSIRPQGGIFGVIARLIQVALPKVFNDHPWIYYPFHVIFSIPIFFINLLAFLLDFLDRRKSVTLNYECILQKKAGSGRAGRRR